MINIIFFIFLPILLTVSGEFLLKNSLNAIELAPGLMGVVSFMTEPMILASLLLIVIGGFLWLIGMSKFELSFMYPFLSINYIVIILGSKFFLNESVSIYRFISALFIIVGLILISRSPYSEDLEKDES